MMIDAGGNQTATWIGIIVSLLGAGGGIVALLKLVKSLRGKLKVLPWVPEEGYYRLTWDGRKMTLEPNADSPPGKDGEGAAGQLPRVNIDITNHKGQDVSLNSLELYFSQLDPVEPDGGRKLIVIKFKDAPLPAVASLLRKYSLQLHDTVGALKRFRPGSDAALDDVVAGLKAATAVVEYASAEAEGQPHTLWEETETVDINLSPGRKSYSKHLRQQVKKNDSLTVKMSLGATESLQGRGAVRLVYDGDKTFEVAEVEIKIIKPPHLKTTERGGR